MRAATTPAASGSRTSFDGTGSRASVDRSWRDSRTPAVPMGKRRYHIEPQLSSTFPASESSDLPPRAVSSHLTFFSTRLLPFGIMPPTYSRATVQKTTNSSGGRVTTKAKRVAVAVFGGVLCVIAALVVGRFARGGSASADPTAFLAGDLSGKRSPADATHPPTDPTRVDLLDLIQPDRDAVAGTWRVSGVRWR